MATFRRSSSDGGPLEIHIYDLSGREMARYTGPVTASWLGDSSGLLITDPPTPGRTTDVQVLDLDGSIRHLVTGVDFDFAEATPGPTGDLLFHRGSDLIAVGRRSGIERLVAHGVTGNTFAWDAAGNIISLDLAAAEVVTLSIDGQVLARSSLHPPQGVRIAVASIGGQSLDRRATFIGFFGDHTWDGGGQNGYGMRLFVDGAVRDDVPGALHFSLATGPHEIIDSSSTSGLVRYDLVTGTSKPAGLRVTTGPMPAAISGSLIFAASNGGPSERVFIGRIGAQWRVVDLPVAVGPIATSHAGPHGTFYVLDTDGAVWSVDGEVAIAQSSLFNE